MSCPSVGRLVTRPFQMRKTADFDVLLHLSCLATFIFILLFVHSFIQKVHSQILNQRGYALKFACLTWIFAFGIWQRSSWLDVLCANLGFAIEAAGAIGLGTGAAGAGAVVGRSAAARSAGVVVIVVVIVGRLLIG